MRTVVNQYAPDRPFHSHIELPADRFQRAVGFLPDVLFHHLVIPGIAPFMIHE